MDLLNTIIREEGKRGGWDKTEAKGWREQKKVEKEQQREKKRVRGKGEGSQS